MRIGYYNMICIFHIFKTKTITRNTIISRDKKNGSCLLNKGLVIKQLRPSSDVVRLACQTKFKN